MDVLVSTVPVSNGVTTTDTDNVFHIANGSHIQSEEGAVVILRSNPLELPMVCGLCGNQYATARELESHMDIHRQGLAIKRSRGRPKGSKTKKPATEELVHPSAVASATSIDTASSLSPGDDTEEADGIAGQARRSHRPVKKPNSDLYIQDEKEMDELLRNEESYTKDNLPQYNEHGMKIARLEDYLSDSVVAIEKSGDDVGGLAEGNLNESGLLNIPSSDQPENSSKQPQSVLENVESHPEQHLTECISAQVNAAMTELISTNELAAVSATEGDNGQNTNLVVVRSSEEGTEPDAEVDNVTHIEVCLEVFGKELGEQTAASSGATDGDLTKALMICELCHKVMTPDMMRQHVVSSHMNSATQEFLCPRAACGRLLSTIPKLRQHLTQDHQLLPPTLSRGYPCDVPDCNTVHKSKHALKVHMSDAHSDLAERSTSCQICHKIFKSRRAQSSHMKAHTKTLEPVTCAKCHKEFKHPSALKFHMSMMPECDKPKYVCGICGYKAVTPWRLNSHQKQVHSTSRPYTCKYCNKTYKTNEMLRQHTYKLHTGTPTYGCDVCHKKFFYAAELREHSQLHNTTKQFVCPICHRAFKTMHVFRGHMNGKHSDTWYSCGFCKFTTSHKKSMKRHMVLVHKLKNVTLEVTPEEPQEVEIIQPESELQTLQLTETGQVINSMQHVQYEEVGNVVIQHNTGEIITHQLAGDVITSEHIVGEVIADDQMSGTVITHEHLTGEVITEEQIDEASIRQLITTHQQAVVDGTMNASEVSQVLVSLSGVGVAETDHDITGSVMDSTNHVPLT